MAWIVLMLGACDGDVCTFNSECEAGSFCEMGACTTECSATMPCPSGQVCSSFGECLDGADVGTTPDAGAPIDASTDVSTDAGPAPECVEHADCDDGDLCNGVETCAGGSCTTGARAAEWTSCTTTSVSGGACRAGVCQPPRCSPTAPFDAPVALDALNTDGDEEYARLSHDELTVYFGSARPDGLGGHDIWTATRASASATFGAPTLLEGVNGEETDTAPTITADGLSLYAVRTSAIDHQIVVTHRSSLDEPFGAFELVEALNGSGTAIDGLPYVLPDHSAIYHRRSRDASSNWDIFRTSRSGGSLGTPVEVNALDVNSSVSDSAPVVTPGELTLYFATARAGSLGNGDIWIARRATTSDPFGAAEHLDAPVNSADGEAPSWISPDGCILYFTRTTAARGRELYSAARGL